MSLRRGRIFGIYVHSGSMKLHLGKRSDVRLAAEGEVQGDKFRQFV